MDSIERLISDLSRLGLLLEKPQLSKIRARPEGPILALAREKMLSEKEAITALASHLNIEYIDLFDPLVKAKIDFERFREKVDPDTLWEHKAIPLWQDEAEVFVAISNPYDADGRNLIDFALDLTVIPVLAEESKIMHFLKEHTTHSIQDFDTLADVTPDTAIELLSIEDGTDSTDVPDAPPIIRLCNKIVGDAVKMDASDIHMEPNEYGLDVRLRIDGIMHSMIEIPKRVKPYVISRFKLLAGMDIAEKRKPQDGRLRVRVSGDAIDLRVSCVPTSHGEQLVLRLLYSKADQLRLENVGFSVELINDIRDILDGSGKCLLVTGPTGSGKTTTLYSCLNHLRTGHSSIQTVEDPVEYRIEGISQIQVNETTGVTFSSALRSVLRQDPDVILVGEIRDAETAQIAFQAAQTGHFVLSTLHTNDAPSVFSRLSLLGVERHLIAESLAGIVAQRLVRTLCPDCKVPADDEYLSKHQRFIDSYSLDPTTLYMECGCENCLHTGFKGRRPIFSFLPMTADVSDAIVKELDTKDFEEIARDSGYNDLTEAAVRFITEGHSSVAEVRPYLVGRKRSSIKKEPLSSSSSTHYQQPQISETQAPSGTAKSLQKPKIVLIEDDEDVRSILAMMLEKEMYDVVEAGDGQKGLEAVYQHNPTVVVCDLMMPVMDGKEFITRMQARENTRDIPILILTAVDSETNEIDLLDLGAQDFVSKTASPNILLSRIRKILHSR